MNRSPLFINLSPFSKLLILVMIMFTTYLLTVFVGFIVGIPFFGYSFFDQLNAENLDNPAILPLFKYFQVISQLGMFIFPALLYAYVIDGKIASYLLAHRRPDGWVLLISCCLILVSMPLISWLIDLNLRLQLPSFFHSIETWMKESEDQAEVLTRAFLDTGSWTGFGVNILMIAVLPALGEEMLFRGVLVRLFRDWTRNIHWGVIISSLLFSTMHFQFYGFLPRLVLGLMLGYTFVWSGNLWIAIAGHLVNNLSAVVMAFLFTRGVITTDYNEAGANPAWLEVFISLGLTVLMMGLIFYRQRYLRRKPHTES